MRIRDFAAFLKIVFKLPYRQLQGVLNQLSPYMPRLQSADYTTLWRRIRATAFEIEQKEAEKEAEGVTVAIDATGMKVSNRGEWMREKWKKRREWIKVHIIVDANTKELLGIEITNELVGDSKEFKNLIDQAEYTLNGRKIVLALADAAHDNKDSFSYLEKKDIQGGIKVRKNASTRARGSPYRARCVRELKKIGYEAWKKKYSYGMRWASKRLFFISQANVWREYKGHQSRRHGPGSENEVSILQ